MVKRFFNICLLLCAALLLPHVAFALVEIPPLQARVTDLTGTLDAPQQTALEARLKALEDKKGSQLAILIVPTTQPEDIAQYSIRVVEQWKLGREKPDDGVLVLVAKDDRKLRIEVGRGLEGAIPDIYAKRIISDVISPRFKQGDFFGGLDAGVDSLTKLIEGEALPAPTQSSTHSATADWQTYLAILFLVGLAGGAVFRALLGRFLGGALSGALVGGMVWLLGAGLFIALLLGLFAFIFAAVGNHSYVSPHRGGGIGNGGFGGGWSGGGDVFSGGGGDFGGGGASGDW